MNDLHPLIPPSTVFAAFGLVRTGSTCYGGSGDFVLAGG
jgi:ATP-dependent protease HslVU (ClpYQ) ATPase subunit